MLDGAFALLNRSLRVDDRALRWHFFRLVFVGIIFFMLWMAQLTGLLFGAPGLQFFRQIAYLNFVFITMAAFGYFSTAITEEKEEETLGLLKMAGISPVVILLGKSTPRIITATLLLSIQFPFTLLATTLGGVSLGQVFAVYWSLLAYMVAVANLALYFSVISKRSGSAAARTFVVLLFFLLLVPGIHQGIVLLISQGNLNGNDWWVYATMAVLGWLTEASIAVQLSDIMVTGFAGSLFSFQVLSNFGAGLFFFALSWLSFDRFTREQKPVGQSRAFVLRPQGRWRKLGSGRAWGNAIMWKEFHFTTGGLTLTLLKFVLYGVVFGGLWVYSVYLQYARLVINLKELGGFLMGSMMWVAAVEVAIYASRLFHHELKWKTLSSLITLPHSLKTIAYSKVAGCLIALIPAGSYFFIGVLLAPSDFFDGFFDVIGEWAAWYGLGQFVIFLHLIVFLSLMIKWGALPLAFVLLYMSNICVIMPLSMLMGGFAMAGQPVPSEWIFDVLKILGIVGEVILIAGFHPLIGYRLRIAAAQ